MVWPTAVKVETLKLAVPPLTVKGEQFPPSIWNCTNPERVPTAVRSGDRRGRRMHKLTVQRSGRMIGGDNRLRRQSQVTIRGAFSAYLGLLSKQCRSNRIFYQFPERYWCRFSTNNSGIWSENSGTFGPGRHREITLRARPAASTSAYFIRAT